MIGRQQMPMDTDKFQNLISFAIDKEQEAYEFYMDLAKKMKRPGMREIFESFAREEEAHKKRLQSLAQQGQKAMRPPYSSVADLKIADYLVDNEPSDDMDYQQSLILAMKREKAAFRLYVDLANAMIDNEDKLALMSLAQEEAKHKLRFELEYDDLLAEN